MAALTDATVVTRQLLERTRELRRDVSGADVDFKSLAFVADEIGELADTLAATFEEIDGVLTRPPFNHAARRTAAAEAQPSEARPPETEEQPSPQQPWLAKLLRPVRWLGGRLRDAWHALASKAPADRAEFA